MPILQPSRLQSLTWNGGSIQLVVDQPQVPPPITVTGALTRGGSGPYQFDLNTPTDLQIAVPLLAHRFQLDQFHSRSILNANVYYNADFGRSDLFYQLVSTGFELKF